MREAVSYGWDRAVSRVEELEGQIKALSSEELQQLRAWFIQFEADLWDQQFDADVVAGRLDGIAGQALKDHSHGRSTEL